MKISQLTTRRHHIEELTDNAKMRIQTIIQYFIGGGAEGIIKE
jgi:hypothetical protein